MTDDLWAPPPGDAALAHTRHSVRFWVLLGTLVVVAVTGLSTVALLTARYRAFTIPSTSMEPTLAINDHVLVRRTHDVHDGDIVIFNGEHSFSEGPGAGPRERDYVKRVIALGGQHVHLAGASVQVDGRVLREPYVSDDPDSFAQTVDLTVPAGRMWVLGDHRADSADSRYHFQDAHQGTVPVDDVIGVVVRHGSRWTAYSLVLEQGAVVGLVAGAFVTGAGLIRRRTLEA